jgi:hypothetical protein
MANETLTPDGNTRNVAGAVTDDSNLYIKRLRIDDSTKGLKVMLVGGAGAGTVATIGITTANGVSGTSDGDATNPKLTISLGSITPSAVQVSGLTASQILGTDASKNLVSLDVATYPSLTELTYVKGVTSAIQTQFTGKLSLAGGTMTAKVTQAGKDEVGKTYTPATGAQTVTLDCSVNNIHIVTGHASGTAITFAITGDTNNQCFIVSILQGAVVSTISAWMATVRWAGGSAPTLTATVGKRDTFGFIRTGASTYDGFIIGQNC